MAAVMVEGRWPCEGREDKRRGLVVLRWSLIGPNLYHLLLLQFLSGIMGVGRHGSVEVGPCGPTYEDQDKHGKLIKDYEDPLILGLV